MKTLLSPFVAAALLVQTAPLAAQQGVGGAGQPLPAALLQCADVAAALTAVTNQDMRLRDWANLARYRDANRTVTRTDAVFMGDSIRISGSSRDSAASSRARATWIAASAPRRLRRCSSGSGLT